MFNMNISAILIVSISIILLHHDQLYGNAFPLSNHLNGIRISSINGNSATSLETDLNICEDQLTKYRQFLLQAIIKFEDVCDAYNQRPVTKYSAMIMPDSMYRGLPIRQPNIGLEFLRNYQPTESRSEIWAFFKLLMAQFDDVEFTNIIRNAVIERCRIKSQQQHDEKRNSVVLGKKQRFHSWGGKRSQSPQDLAGGNDSETDIA